LSLAEADAAVSTFKSICKPLRTAGIHLFLHNHGYEAVATGGPTMLDRILAAVDPRCLDLQIDVFWAQSAGMDPAQLIRKYGHRVTSIHLKDMRHGAVSKTPWTAEKRDSVPLGTGSLDIRAILSAAHNVGVGSLIIEDESPDAEQQIPQSMKFLRDYH
jgi:sugar phosphate isomerase/epimerase